MLSTLGPFALLIAALIAGLRLADDGRRRRQMRERLQLIDQAQQLEARPSLKLIRDDLLSNIPALHRWLAQWRGGARLHLWLQQADAKLQPGKFLVMVAGSAAAGGLLGLVLASGWGWFAGLGVGAWLPCAVLGRRRRRRLAKFTALFPGAIDLLVRACRAGHPPNSSFELIANEMPEPVAGEFRQVFEQQRFGLPLRDCLLQLARRVPEVDVQFFAVAIIIQRDSGGNLAEILEKLATLIRARFQLRRQVNVHTAQGRMTLWVLMALAPLLLLAMLSLSHGFVMPLFTDPLGRMMLGLAAGLQLVGWVLLKKVLALEV